MPVGGHSHGLQFRLVTENRWLLCQADTMQSRLVDLLNANPEKTMLVQIDSLSSPDAAAGSADAPVGRAVGINTAAILYGVPVEAPGAAPAKRSPAWVERSLWRVRIGLGPYEIVGNIHMPKGTRLTEAVLAAMNVFFVVTDATIRRADGSAFQERVIAVNRSRLEYIMPEPVGS